jgi:cytoskeleton protein RodZ
MNLSDATGENIAYGVKVKGRVMPVTGIPPFVVTLGAPEVVKIRYSGEPLDMSFLPSGRIAKFDLPLSE